MATKRVGRYDVGVTLGEGTFGKVKYAVNTETGEAVAIKVLDKGRIQQQKMEQQIKREIAIMKMIRHRYVVQLREVLASKTKIFIVLELVTGGELFDKLVTDGRFTETRARFYFQQLIEGVEYCHSQGVIHRDLKPENLLLDDQMNLKISDFGLSALYTGSGEGASRTTLLHTTCGTPNYVAPEVLADKGYDGRTADVWSCGVILYVLLAAFLPFDEPTLVALFERIQRAEFSYPSWFSPQARSLLDAILVADPARRATISQIKQHPWFTGRDVEEHEVKTEEGEEEEGSQGHRRHCRREHCCPISPPPPPTDEDIGASVSAAPGVDSWLVLNSQSGTAATRPAGSRRLLQFAVAGRKDVRAIVQGIMLALKEDMEMDVRAKEAGRGVHKIKATRLTPRGLLGVIFEIHDPYASPSPEYEHEEERAYKRHTKSAGAEAADDSDDDQGKPEHVVVEIRRGKGDILAFRQFYHDFVRYHLPPLLPPLLHASATTSLVVASEPGMSDYVGMMGSGPQRLPSFSSVPGAK